MTSRRNWYVAHEILCFEPKHKTQRNREKWTVWENLILVEARNPKEAYAKAVKRGRENEGPVKIDGEAGYCRFRGLRELSYIYDELEDGTELEWRTFQSSPADVSRLITPRQKLQAFGLALKGKKGSTRAQGEAVSPGDPIL